MAPMATTPTVSFETYTNIINGGTRGAKSHYTGTDPSTKDPLWKLPVATKDDVNDAVAAALKAFPAWSRTSIEERSEKMAAFAEGILS